MKPKLNEIKGKLLAAATLATALFATSCSNDSGADTDTTTVKVAFTMSVSEASETRANEDWSDYYPSDPGTADESAINMRDLKIKICDADGNVIANVGDVYMTQVYSNGTAVKGKYNVTGTWNASQEELGRAQRVTVLANCGTAAEGNSLGTLSYNVGQATEYIPMWGVAPFKELLQDPSGDESKLGQVDMLRAMAKVQVNMLNEMKDMGYEIAKLTLNNINTSGYCVPENYTGVERTSQLRYDNSLHPLTSLSTGRDFTTNVLYAAEYDNTSAGATPSTITVTLNRNGEYEGTYTLRFCHYDTDGAPTENAYDIQRNHFYQYNIYKKGGQIIVTLHVRPWHERKHTEIIM